MLFSARRSILAACVAILSVQPLAGHAQTTLDLSYGPASPCTFVTDSHGIHLDPATGHLLANGSFGSGCQTSLPDPSFTDPLAGDIPASVVTGVDLTLGWSVANATSCVYNGSSFPAGFSSPNWPTSGSACNSTSSCASAHSATVTASVDGTYNFNLTCIDGNNPTTVSSAAITVASVDGGEAQCTTGPPALTQITNTDVTYISAGYAVAPRVDVTQYSNIWGRYSPSGTILPWPDQNNVLVYIMLGKDQFLSTKFTVPSPYTNPHTSGRMARGEVVQIGDVSRTSASISEVCGDFVNVPPACVIDSGYIGSPLLQWSLNGAIPGTCPLVPGHTYYYNFMMSPLANPDPQHSYCDQSSCVMSTVPYYVN